MKYFKIWKQIKASKNDSFGISGTLPEPLFIKERKIAAKVASNWELWLPSICLQKLSLSKSNNLDKKNIFYSAIFVHLKAVV